MKLTHKFKLVPVDDESRHVSDMRDKMDAVLRDQKLDQHEKAALYEDLLARMRNLKASMDTVPKVQILEAPEHFTPRIPLSTMNRHFWNENPEIQTNAKEEVIINGNVIPDSNISDYVNFARGKTAEKPHGYENVEEIFKTLGKKRIKAVTPRVRRVPSPNKVVTRLRGKKAAAAAAAGPSEKTDKTQDSISQAGSGPSKRLYIKLWNL